MMTPTMARAQSESECQELLNLADRALAEQRKLIGMQSDQISDLRFNYSIVRARLDEVDRENNAWYKRPEIIVPLSFIAGAFAMKQVGK